MHSLTKLGASLAIKIMSKMMGCWALGYFNVKCNIILPPGIIRTFETSSNNEQYKATSTTKLIVPVLKVSISTAEQFDKHNIIYRLQICEISALLGILF